MTQSANDITAKEVILNLKRGARFLYLKRKSIILFAILGGVLGLAISLLVPKKYIAETVFVLETGKKGGASDYANIAAKFGLSIGGTSGGLFQEDDNVITFIKSRTIVAQTLYTSFDQNSLLIERYLEFSGLKKKWEDEAGLGKLMFHSDVNRRSRIEDSVITFVWKTILEDNLYVEKPDMNGDLIVTKTVFSDEIFSKIFNERLLENVIQFYTQIQTKKSLENVAILQHQVDSVNKHLRTSLSSVAVFSDANPNLNPARQSLRVPSQLSLVQAEMSKAILEELVKNLELAKITLRKEAPLFQIIDKPVLPLEVKKIGRIKGAFTGSILFGLFVILYHGLKRVYRKVLAS